VSDPSIEILQPNQYENNVHWGPEKFFKKKGGRPFQR